LDILRIKNCKFYHYQIPLKRVFSISGITIDSRQGIIIVLEDDNGFRAMGDIAPLPGLSNEKLKDILILLPKIEQFLCNRTIEKGDPCFDPSLPPSVRFAIESASYSLFAERGKKSLAKVINLKATEKVLINALLLRGESSDAAKIDQIKKSGYQSIKIKVAPQTLKTDIKRIIDINELFEGEISFRLDANRSLTISETKYLLGRIENIPLDYLEEPLQDAHLLEQLYEETGCRYGLDESLIALVLKNKPLPQGLKTAIIKPQLYGGWQEIKWLVNKLEEQKVQIVISDIFSSGVGVNSLLQYAAALRQEEFAMGLDTYNYLKKDVLLNRLPFSNGEVDIEEAWRFAQRIDFEKMIKLDL
jgi:O-succinylbenzoate synthase